MNTSSPDALTLDMLYHPRITHIYHVFQSTVFFISSSIFLPSIYIVLVKSTPEMGIYKLLLISQIIWSYLADFCMFVWQPVLLYPFFMAYSTGVTRSMGPTSVYLMYCLTFLFMTGLVHATFFSMVFRVSKLYEEWRIYWIFEDMGKVMKWWVLTLVPLEAFVFRRFI